MRAAEAVNGWRGRNRAYALAVLGVAGVGCTSRPWTEVRASATASETSETTEAAETAICRPWFEPGMAPEHDEHVGYCGVPG